MALAALAYGAAVSGGYVFDDVPAIRDNPALQAGDWWGAAYRYASPLANRPLATFSLVLDAGVFADACTGHHVGNVLLHLVATALAFAVVRAALRTGEHVARTPAPRATALAFAAAATWAVHPLCADAVAYATQRSTLLMAVFALLAFLATLRAENGPRKAAWRALAVVAVVLAMLAKEDAVVLPILLLLFVRAFLASRRGELRRFAPFLGAVAASWIALAFSVASGPRNPTVGYATKPPCTAIEWLQTQAGIVVHYLRLALLPIGQRGCYDWPIVRALGPAVVPGAAILGLLAATVWACVRRPRVGFHCAWVFLWLAPTSTVLPIVTELAAERRMYLPLLAVAVGFAFSLEAIAARIPSRVARWALFASILAALVAASWQRVAVYRDEAAFWTEAYELRNPSHRTLVASVLLNDYARVLRERGDLAGARACFAEAVACEDAPSTVRLHYATLLFELGEDAAAAPVLAALRGEEPQLGELLHGRAQAAFEQCLQARAQSPTASIEVALAGAIVLARMAAAVEPGRAPFHNTLATLLGSAGRVAEAESAYRAALALDPGAEAVQQNLAELLLRAGRARDATPFVRGLLARRPRDVALRIGVAESFLAQGEVGFARTVVDELLRLAPEDVGVRALAAAVGAVERR